jgi:hypothetical protein
MKYSNKSYSYFALFICSALALFTSLGFSKEPDPLEKYFPEDAGLLMTTIRPWKADGPAKIFRGKELFDYIDGGAEIFFEYGFSRAIARRYASGDKSITVDIYEMNNPKAAFGIYSVQRDSKTPALAVGDDGSSSETMVSFCQERFYVIIAANLSDDSIKKISVQIALAVSQKINKSSPLPDLLGKLPKSNLVPRSEGYVSGLLGLNTQLYLGDSNILGINGRTVECVFAHYQNKENEAHLLAIRYPGSAAATAAFNSAREAFNSNKKFKSVTMKDLSVFSDKRNLFCHLVADNNFLYIISKAGSIDLIQEIESSIRALNKKAPAGATK